jgi:hypothetical protein
VLPLTYCQVEDGERLFVAWRSCGVPAPRPLYNLPRLLASPDAPVIITEDEKKADLVPTLFVGYVGITSMGGARAAKKSDWGSLSSRNVVIWPDNDEAGRQHADDVAKLATKAGRWLCCNRRYTQGLARELGPCRPAAGRRGNRSIVRATAVSIVLGSTGLHFLWILSNG